MSTRIYCYAGETGEDPHEVQLELSDEDSERVRDKQLSEHVGRFEFGGYVQVTDQQTGMIWMVASAPCGEMCHCAAVAVPVAV